MDNAVAEVERELGSGPSECGPLNDQRSLIAYILLCLVTCGIYGYYFIYTVARDINIACADDDEETAGLGVYLLLSIVTCGFYNIYWMYRLGNRLTKTNFIAIFNFVANIAIGNSPYSGNTNCSYLTMTRRCTTEL